MLPNKLVIWFKDVGKEDVAQVGEKGANLGEMTQAGFPVPNGFIVTAAAYYHFLRENELEIKIKHLLGTIDYSDPKSLEKVSKQIKKLITHGKMSDELVQQIFTFYEMLSGILKNTLVAVRFSATAEDLSGPSLAGQQETYLIVKGEANLLLAVKDAWASLFEARAIFYRYEQKYDHFKTGIAITVQKMMESESSGSMLSLDPLTNDKSIIVIEAVFGLREQGTVTPDHYEVHKQDLTIKSKKVIEQKITDEQIRELAALSKKLEHHYYFPQVSEWTIAKGEIFLIQTQPITQQVLTKNTSVFHTATKVYVNLAEPDLAPKIATYHIDGIGLLRAEFMMANIGIHPKKMIRDGKSKEYIQELAKGIEQFCRAFSPRPVVYRASDFKTNEYRNLIGGKELEPEEPNPILGFRGACRYIHDPEIFHLELEAIKLIKNKLGLKNLWLMLPFVRTVNELIEVKKLIASAGLYRSPSFKLWMMVEIPSNVILLEKFIEQGIDGVSIDPNNLTMLILGTDRDNGEITHEFNEENEAVIWALEKVIKTTHKYKITSSLCEQAASVHPALLEKLVSWGITSVSVNSDVIEKTREHISEIEKRLITHG